ncbi:tryptophan synthase subunit alpha [Bacillus sp. Bva_UNVM-123]|uniref:tryptophan synthase subunit alpha n=1 Tax=Bacillus sp. Bva_UNVM-123 TaxID=2829798 RepID=UPI00391F685A
MKRIERTMESLQERGEKAFIPYIMAGDGGLEVLPERILFLEKAGATAIEIGIPFSDPVADGPVIQEAGKRALEKRTSLKAIIKTVEKIRLIVKIPLILMTYMNPIISYGIQKFIDDCVHAGIDGIIIPDLPIEEEEIIAPHATQKGIEIIRLVTLTSPLKRIEQIAKRGNGFLYAVTVTGVTGVRNEFNEKLADYFSLIKTVSKLPIMAGFGISTPSQVQEITKYCDGVIVGSKIIELFNDKNYAAIEELINASKNDVRIIN